jgi:hypothetical protein
MKRIFLTRGKVAIVDNRDFKWLSQWKWHASKGSRGGGFYASRFEGRKMLRMHVVIADPPEGKRVDHKNRDTLDNQRQNLRVCFNKNNSWNQCIRKDNTSGFKSVCWCKQKQKWKARIGVLPRVLHLGFFATAKLAGEAYERAATKYHGEFARIK